MLTYLISTILPIACKVALISGITLLISTILMIIFGGLSVASDSLLGSFLCLIGTLIPAIIARISGAIFGFSLTATVILFLLKLFL